jgi:hypothetical protein
MPVDSPFANPGNVAFTVRGWFQRRYCVDATIPGQNHSFFTGALIDDSDGRARNNRTADIFYESADTALIDLCPGNCRQCHTSQTSKDGPQKSEFFLQGASFI